MLEMRFHHMGKDRVFHTSAGMDLSSVHITITWDLLRLFFLLIGILASSQNHQKHPS
jgi:hypothetical protein